MKISHFRSCFNPEDRALTITCDESGLLTVSLTEGARVVWSDDTEFTGEPLFESTQQLLVVYALHKMLANRWLPHGFDVVIPDDSSRRLGIINRDVQEAQLATEYAQMAAGTE